MRVSIYHNIVWAKYKGAVFSELYNLSCKCGIDVSFVQIAETETIRTALSGIDYSYHNYPFRLLFKGAYDNPSALKRIALIAKDLLQNPCDLVVIPGYDRIEYWVMLFLCILLRRKRAVFCDSTIHDRPRVAWKELVKGFFFSRCDGFLAYGVRSRDYLMSYGVDQSAITVGCQAAALPHGYNAAEVIDEYRAKSKKQMARSQFIYVGRLSPEKGLFNMLDAFKMVYSKFPTTRLCLIGGGPLKDQLLARIAALGLEDVISIVGSKAISEIAPLFLDSVALVLPSHSEPWGLVVNESLSYGCPVVVSNACGCVPELVIEGVNGHSFNAGDVDGMSTAMVSVMGMSVDRLSVATKCLAIVAEFTPSRAAARILDRCARIIGCFV